MARYYRIAAWLLNGLGLALFACSLLLVPPSASMAQTGPPPCGGRNGGGGGVCALTNCTEAPDTNCPDGGCNALNNCKCKCKPAGDGSNKCGCF
jgi:hypothetical protein